MSGKIMIKQLNWDNPNCVDFRKRRVGRTDACLKNATGSLCAICDPDSDNHKGYFKKKLNVITS